MLLSTLTFASTLSLATSSPTTSPIQTPLSPSSLFSHSLPQSAPFPPLSLLNLPPLPFSFSYNNYLPPLSPHSLHSLPLFHLLPPSLSLTPCINSILHSLPTLYHSLTSHSFTTLPSALLSLLNHPSPTHPTTSFPTPSPLLSFPLPH